MATDRASTLEALRRYAENFNRSLTVRSFGGQIDFPSTDRVRVTLSIEPRHRGGMGSEAVNGGVMAAMFDLVLGCAGALIDPERRNATMQLSMSFERALLGDLLVAEGWVDRAGGRIAFTSAVIKDGTGQVCGRAQGVVRLTDLRWANEGSPAIN